MFMPKQDNAKENVGQAEHPKKKTQHAVPVMLTLQPSDASFPSSPTAPVGTETP